MNRKQLLSSVATYYTGRIRAFGATHLGVDWNSKESQALRFDQLLSLLNREPPNKDTVLLDFGCGYGGLLDYIIEHESNTLQHATYLGYDISQDMLAAAISRHPDQHSRFIRDLAAIDTVDFTVASGIFNVKGHTDARTWASHVEQTLDEINQLSRSGFAFNMLTSYSDSHCMRDDLFYGDPCYFLDLCANRYSPHVALLHDYGLYEFTLLVRKH
jgi:SAM-dependent methyltransferase